MKKLLYLSAVLLLLLSACADDKGVLEVLNRAESLMEEHPDSSYALLVECDSLIPQQSRRTRMHHLMLVAEAANKLYRQMPSDTLFLEAVDYYDHHGTPNQQLKAHYLLGCIYRDMKEAPQAIQCYYDAVEKVDTLSGDCDYTTLFRVYGQMADVFNRQIMPDEELEALEKYSKYALKAGNTYRYLQGIERSVSSYNLKGDTAMILSTENLAHNLYMEYGFRQAAAGAYTTSMYIYIERKDFKKAHELMQLFETESGLFDGEGNIKKGREHYYHCKGLYYLGVNQLDSAEFYFKKLLRYGYSFDAYRGLIEVCQERGDAASVIKYSELYTASFDTLVTDIHAEAARQAVGMYDYTRNQKLAAAKAIEAERNRSIIYVIATATFFIVTFLLCLYLHSKIKNKKKVSQLSREIADTSAQYEKTKEELAERQMQVEDFQTQYGNLKQKENWDAMMQSPVVEALKERLQEPLKSRPVSDKEWELLTSLLCQNLPLFHARIIGNCDLSLHEQHVTILTRLGFHPNDMVILLNLSQQHVTNIRKSANKKLFSDDSARTFSKNLNQI
ncbi:MAG: hypothetical protein IJ635_03790 [Bacteroidaceae bacterium]|nr:hypothetical protein [Bacteroidaceae bacterium]